MSRRAASGRFGWGGIGVLLAAGGLATACGGDAPSAPAETAPTPAAPAAEAAPGAGGAPVIEWAAIEPMDPQPDTMVRAMVRASDPDGERVRVTYSWRVGGRPAGEGETLTLRGASKGELVEVEVVATDGSNQSAVRRVDATVDNQPPRLYRVDLEAPKGLSVGAPLLASPEGIDPDGDPLEFEYEWSVNGELWSEARGPSFPTENLRRGDKVSVAVVARDGEDQSALLESDPQVIGNAAPDITSNPTWTKQGERFTYQVEAQDPDGDRTLRYSLLKAPSGMTIDGLTGMVTWVPREGQAGSHAVELEVDDSNGGKTVQTFNVVMELEKAAEQPPAAAPRGY